jgi:hypothetical protein
MVRIAFPLVRNLELRPGAYVIPSGRAGTSGAINYALPLHHVWSRHSDANSLAADRDAKLGFTFSLSPAAVQQIEGAGKPSFPYFESGFIREIPCRRLEQPCGAVPRKLQAMANAGAYDEVVMVFTLVSRR